MIRQGLWFQVKKNVNITNMLTFSFDEKEKEKENSLSIKDTQ